MLITKKSMFSGKEHTMDIPITEQEYHDWMNSSKLIQDMFPNLTASQREFLMTGTTDEEWNEAFPDE